MSTLNDRTKLLRHCSLLGAVVVISLIIKILNEGSLSYWLDEAYTIWFANLSFHEIWFWIPEFESHPPLYYSLVKLWETFGGETLGLSYRGLSIFLSLLLVLSSYYSVKKVSQHLQLEAYSAALFNTFLICFSPIFVWFSIEARPYILLSLSYSIAILGLLSIISNDQERGLRGWFIFSAGAVLTNWSHNLGGIFTAVLFLSLLAHWVIDQKFAKSFFYKALVCTVVVLLFSLPLLFQIIHQLVYWGASSWVSEPTLTGFIQIMRRLFGFGYADKYMDTAFGSFQIVWFARIALGIIVGIASFLITLYGLYKLIQLKRPSLACFFVLSSFGVPVASAVISYAGPNIFLERTLLPSLIPYFMLLSISIGFIERKSWQLAIKALFIVVLALGLFATLSQGKKEPWNIIAEELRPNVGANDVVLLLPNDLILPLKLYDDGEKLAPKISSVPAEFPAIKYSDFYPDGFPSVPGVRVEDSDKIRQMLKRKDRVFLITREEALFDPKRITRSVLAEKFNMVSEKSWDNIFLYQFERK